MSAKKRHATSGSSKPGKAAKATRVTKPTQSSKPSGAPAVITFGEILWDIYETGPHTFERQLGGAPANVATDLARLGVPSAVIGGVGADRFGDALARHLEADGVDTRFVLRFPNRTGITFIATGEGGEPSFLFYRHDSADMAVVPEQITPEMARAAWVLVGTSTMITKPLARATVKLLELAADAGSGIFVDLNVRAHLWPSAGEMKKTIGALVRCADLVKASDADLAALAGEGATEEERVAWLQTHAPNASWLLTFGANGASAVGDHGVISAPSKRVRCVDATGAGDAFIAGALAALIAADARPDTPAWAEPDVWTSVVEIGHMMGAKAVSVVGAVAGVRDLEPIMQRLQALRRSSNR